MPKPRDALSLSNVLLSASGLGMFGAFAWIIVAAIRTSHYQQQQLPEPVRWLLLGSAMVFFATLGGRMVSHLWAAVREEWGPWFQPTVRPPLKAASKRPGKGPGKGPSPTSEQEPMIWALSFSVTLPRGDAEGLYRSLDGAHGRVAAAVMGKTILDAPAFAYQAVLAANPEGAREALQAWATELEDARDTVDAAYREHAAEGATPEKRSVVRWLVALRSTEALGKPETQADQVAPWLDRLIPEAAKVLLATRVSISRPLEEETAMELCRPRIRITAPEPKLSPSRAYLAVGLSLAGAVCGGAVLFSGETRLMWLGAVLMGMGVLFSRKPGSSR